MQNYNQKPGGTFKKNIFGIIFFGIIVFILGILRLVIFNGIKDCKDEGIAVVIDIEYSTSSDGDDMYTYTYLVDGYSIKARTAVSTQRYTMEEVSVKYNAEKDLIYTDFEYTLYRILCWISYVMLAFVIWNAILLTIKIVALLGVAGVMIHTNNMQNQQELEQWQQQQQMNNMNSNNSGYNLNGYNENGMNMNMGMDNTNGNGQFMFGNNMYTNQNEQNGYNEQSGYTGQNGYNQNGYDGYNEQNEYNQNNYNNQQYQ